MLAHVVNFLKNLHYVEGASPLTLKAYALDLYQAFHDLSLPRVHLSQGTNTFNIDAEHIESPDWSEELLMASAKKALNRWSTLSPATRQRKCATLKSFFGYLFREEVTDRDLGSQIVLPKSQQKIPHFISIDEIISLVSSIDNDIEKNHGDKTAEILKARALILLLYGGGLRVSEACNLRWAEINPSQRTLLIKGKGGKERQVVVPAVTIRSLDELDRAQEYIFGEKPLNTRTAYSWVREWGAKAGLIKPLHPHALRHSFATHLLAGGTDLRILQEMLGHESLTSTQKYTHLNMANLSRTIESHHPLGHKESLAKADKPGKP
ncbi:MAG: tyrosine-type recombinase/integrase [Bdellovibrionales bacterium]|nr:tyrosine-type recombinase/integrase [Bdellovibrionales bacterium]